MAQAFLIRIGVLGALAVILAPAICSANQLNIHPAIPVRPQIHLSPSLHMDARSRSFDDIDLSDACRPDVRLRKSKRERRCRQER
jgi:hypothetical protein